jgi:hypothetical protein
MPQIFHQAVLAYLPLSVGTDERKSYDIVASQRCPNLEGLELRHSLIDAAKVKVTSFPKHLRHLGIVDCELINLPSNQSFFFQMDKIMPGTTPSFQTCGLHYICFTIVMTVIKLTINVLRS